MTRLNPPAPIAPVPPLADPGLRVDDFDYDLPTELIAQTPLAERDGARLLVLGRTTGAVDHRAIRDLPDVVRPGDLLVANNSRVLPGRLRATKPATGARVELLLLREREVGCWTALARPARKLLPGTALRLLPREGVDAPPVQVVVRERGTAGEVVVEIDAGVDLAHYGEPPLPPYISERLPDPERYQTVYASAMGSAAAPTAGLHVTAGLRSRLAERGVGWAEVTLHVGLDTFRPVSAETVGGHRIHREWCAVDDATARAVAATRAAGGRVVAVGTTAARTLETLGAAWDEGRPAGMVAETGLFIVPGYRWRLVDGLLTNFHLPRSTLLMMVSALAGREATAAAYRVAVAHRYRFFSFGDAMLVL